MSNSYVIHKRIHDAAGDEHALCPVTGNAMTAYVWDRVTCKVCQRIGSELDYNSRQMREVARLRREKRAEFANDK